MFTRKLIGLAVLSVACQTRPDPVATKPSVVDTGTTQPADPAPRDRAERAKGAQPSDPAPKDRADRADRALPAQRGELVELGTPVTESEVSAWDIDVRPDGRGLPPGQGTARRGREVYAKKCASCHGQNGEGRRVEGALLPYPALKGGVGTLAKPVPVKTVASYWPYATTIYDYVYRTMPLGRAQSLTVDETYSVVAYILYLNGLIGEDDRLDQRRLPAVRMPNRDGFVSALVSDRKQP